MGERPFRRVLSGPCEQEPAGGDLAERRRVPPHVCNGRRTSGGRSLGTILLNVARHHLIKSDLIGCELVSPGLSFPHQAPLALFRSFQPSLLPHDYLDNGDACALRVRTLRASPNRITVMLEFSSSTSIQSPRLISPFLTPAHIKSSAPLIACRRAALRSGIASLRDLSSRCHCKCGSEIAALRLPIWRPPPAGVTTLPDIGADWRVSD